MKQVGILITTGTILLLLVGCNQGTGNFPVTPDSMDPEAGITSCVENLSDRGKYLNWGNYQFNIARDGTNSEVIPLRTTTSWGIHLNALKLLEDHPCSDCVRLKNVHLLDNGDVSVDIEITHPWPYNNKFCTGFDVCGIIMFPSSQNWPDQELRILMGLEPWEGSHWERWSDNDLGDAELMNAENWTLLWCPDKNWIEYEAEIPQGFPIFEYFPGHYSSGENIGTYNPFIRFYTNENRHMFEVGKSDTRTYIIRPPSQGDIEACYAVYAHWAVPINTPVIDPSVDFPPEANSPMPYEFYITQDELLDPDAPTVEQANHLTWHVKMWIDPIEDTGCSVVDLAYGGALGGNLHHHPSGEQDDYIFPGFTSQYYGKLEDPWPGEYTYIFNIRSDTPGETHDYLCTTKFITKIAFKESDGSW